MSYFAKLSLLLAVFITPMAVHATEPPTIGQPAPLFEAIDSNGKAVKLEEFKGKTVVLEWTNHECPFVKKHYEPGSMQKAQKEAKEKGAVWLSIVSSAVGKQGYLVEAEAQTIFKEKGFNSDHLILDATGRIGHMYEAKTTPHMFVINPEGVLVYMGAIDSIASADSADIENATNYVLAAIDAINADVEPEHTNTKPYGCSVKY